MKRILLLMCSLVAVAGYAYGQGQRQQLPEPELIRVETNGLSMVFSAYKGGNVFWQYWGDKIGNDRDFVQNSRPGGQPMLPAYGGMYDLTPALRLTHGDGVLTTELEYVRTTKKFIDNNRTETVVTLKDKLYAVQVDVTFTAYGAENIITQQVKVTNNERGTLTIENMPSSYFPVQADKYYLTSFYGSWGAEMTMQEEELTHGTKVLDNRKGIRSVRDYSPSFLISTDRPASEDEGEVFAGSLAWAGNHELRFTQDAGRSLHVESGMNFYAAEYHLTRGQSMVSPPMILTYSSNGKGQVSRNFHDWARNYWEPNGHRLNPILLNSWEGVYLGFNQEKIVELIDGAAEIGVEMFVLDDGWFGNKYPRDDTRSGLGDWEANTTKLPGGLAFLADHAVSKGIKFGIWVELEMVNPRSELAERHPEWVVQSGEREIPQMRTQWLLDLSNPKVQDFVFESFVKVMSASPNISYVKWDANRYVGSVGSTFQTKDNQTHFWYDYIMGLYSVYERIREKYPEVWIQACGGGGSRMDYGMMHYHDEFWTSDNTNAPSRVFMQYGVSTFFPAKNIASHVSASPNHQSGQIIPLKFRFDVSMSGRLGFELQPRDFQGTDKEFSIRAVETYKQIRPIVQLGDLYRLKNPYDGSGWSSLMYVSKDRKQSVFFAFSVDYHSEPAFYTKLSGLDPAKMYKVTELNMLRGRPTFTGHDKTFSGDYLMKVGITLPIKQPYTSTVLLLSEQ